MPTTRPDAHATGPRARAVALLLALGLAGGAAGCSLPFGDDPPPKSYADQLEPASQLRGVLQARAEAVRTGALAAFMESVDRTRQRFVRQQRRYFANLQELPLAQFSYTVPEGGVSLLSDGRLQAVVQVSTQLRGYDRVPVVSPRLYTFRRDDRLGTWVLNDDRDEEFEADNDIEMQPWELLRLEVEEGAGVLGLFDRGSIDAAYQIMDTVEDGISAVASEVPVEWARQVVVYALSDISVLAALDNLPGGDPQRLDGVAFPVQASPGSRELAGHRFMLHPRMIDRDGASRDRLVRHELTHVALAERDDRVPTWLSEGIAEYVSVQPIPELERMISRDAVDAARDGVDALPSDKAFNGPRSGANYGIAWYACEVIAQRFGEDRLWQLLEAMRADEGTTEDDQDAVLRRELGLDSRALARLAGEKISATFD